MGAFDGFPDFMRANNPKLSRFAYLLAGNHADAQDLLQTALTRTAVRWRTVARYDDPTAYVRRVMVNESVSWWRRRRRLRIDAVEWAPERAHPDGAPGTESRIVLWAALDRLTVRQRSVLVLRYYEDLSVDDAAAVLGCAPGTIKSQTHKALDRLRTLVPELELEVLP